MDKLCCFGASDPQVRGTASRFWNLDLRLHGSFSGLSCYKSSNWNSGGWYCLMARILFISLLAISGVRLLSSITSFYGSISDFCPLGIMNLRSLILSGDGHLRLQVCSSQYMLCSHFGIVRSTSIFLVCKGSFFNHSKLQGVWNSHAFIKY